ncbi:MAG: GAF domain-containing sensor histidine kinase [Nitrospinae bacterium]|nr:GAF domain-containing sensor histidine kinase [Nitrospinota bacterium]
MTSNTNNERVTEEYRVLHKVAQILQNPGDLIEILQDTMKALTEFEGLKVENKAGVFLADNTEKVLRLLTTYGDFSQEFIDKEKIVPFGDCLCGRAAASGELLMSESCFTDSRHERKYSDMRPHGHYIVPLKSFDNLVGVLFLYSDTHPSWYQHSQEVLLSIGGLIANTIERKKLDEELDNHRNNLEDIVATRTQDLVQSKEQYRKLNNQIQMIREEEKSRLAREVHDQLGQALTALKMDTIHINKKLSPNQVNLKDQAQSMIKTIDETIKSVQHIATELRPPILDAFGICEAIAWQSREYEKRYKIPFDLNCLQDHVEIDKDLQTTLFRIFQEAVTNILRHANATRVQVRMTHEKNVLTFAIGDDGIGIKEKDIESPESLGLIGIKERVYPWEGEVNFESSPGKGTLIIITVPLKRQ